MYNNCYSLARVWAACAYYKGLPENVFIKIFCSDN